MGLIQELRRRKVTRVAAVYVVTGWLLVQIVDVVGEPLRLPEWFSAVVVILVALGLPLALILAWAFEMTPEGVQRASSDNVGVVVPPGQSPIDYFIVALLVIAIGWMGYDSLKPGDPVATSVPEQQVVANDQQAGVLHNSIAVLPFENLSPDPDNAYFAAGMHEEVLNHLAKIRDLTVIARTTMTRYADSDKSIPVIGKELNVLTVMEGSVRYAGHRVRITAQLIDVTTGAHLWSEAYDRDLEDIFSIQSDIALNITGAMKAEFAVAEQQAIATRPTNNTEAYSEYVKALQLLGQVPMPIALALTHLDKALELDPNFAKALGYASEAYTVAAVFDTASHPLTPQSQTSLAERGLVLANRALALDPGQANAYVGLSRAASINRRWDDALRFAKKAYELNPGVPTAVFHYAQEFGLRGNEAEARKLIDRAMELDPLNANYAFFGTVTMIDLRQWDDALGFARQAMAMAPAHPGPYVMAAFASSRLGDSAGALKYLQQAEQRYSSFPNRGSLLALMFIYGELGMEEELGSAFERINEWNERQPLHDGDWTRVYSALGDVDKVFEHANRMIDANFPAASIPSFAFPDRGDLFLRGIVDHPGFEELVQKARSQYSAAP